MKSFTFSNARLSYREGAMKPKLAAVANCRILFITVFVFLMGLAVGAQDVAVGPAAAPRAPRPPVEIMAGVKSPLVSFAERRLRRALAARGYRLGPGGRHVTLRLAQGPAQSFAIEPETRGLAVTGGDARGLMYGALRVAEELRLGRRLSAVPAMRRHPALAIRAFKYNLPLPGTSYLAERNLRRHRWFWKLGYWRAFLDTLADDRFDALELWSAEPWEEMIRLRRFPEANALPPAVLARHIKFFQRIFAMAHARGIDVYLVTWNVDLGPAFARAHHIPSRNVNNLLVRRYMRACIRDVLRTYPNLTGLGTTQGEQMGVIPPDRRAGWIARTYFRAIRQSGRKQVPFILRYWGGTPAATERAAARYRQGPVYLDIKYNGEHAFSSPRYHLANLAWIKQSHRYRVLWHLRNDDIFLLRWGSPEFVRELMRNLARTQTAGFTLGSEGDVPGADNYDTPRARARRHSAYEFQKQWWEFGLFGRLGYQPEVMTRLWRQRFRLRYGRAGDALYDAGRAAGRIAPLVTSFHWNYMNGDWMVEGSVGSWNTSAEQPRVNYRRAALYHDIRSWIFNNTIDAGLRNDMQFAAGRLAGLLARPAARSPREVANELAALGRQAMAARRVRIAAQARGWGARQDDVCWGELARYYAEKIRAAADLSLYLFSGRASAQRRGIARLRRALAFWKELARDGDAHYRAHEVWQFGVFSWARYTPAVARDIAIARGLRPYRVAAQGWQASAIAGAGASLSLRIVSPFAQAGLEPWLLYADQLLNREAARKIMAGAAGLRWQRQLPAPPLGKAWLLILPPMAGARVMLNNAPVEGGSGLTMPHAEAEYFRLPRGGALAVETRSESVPVLALIARGGETSSALAPARVWAPVAASAGLLRLAKPLQFPRDWENVRREVFHRGSAEYRLRLPAAGLYRLSARLRAAGGRRQGVFFSVDEDNPYGRLGAHAGTGWRWAAARAVFALGAGVHTVRLYWLKPGVDVRGVRLEAVGAPPPNKRR